MGMFLKNFRVSVVEKRKKDDQNKLVQDLGSRRFSKNCDWRVHSKRF